MEAEDSCGTLETEDSCGNDERRRIGLLILLLSSFP
jgi:hypothetical protein